MFKHAVRKLKHKLGFTMMETLVVVGIIAVTTCIAVPSLISVHRSTQLTKRNDYAKAIYMAAQDNLNQMRASGELSLLIDAADGLDDVAGDLTAQHMPIGGSSYQYSYSKGDNPSYDLIVPGSLDTAIRNEEIIIEYNPKAGVVYSVFYYEEEDIRTLYNDQQKNHTIRGAEGTTDRERRKLGVGYYSVENLDGLEEMEFAVFNAASAISYENGQEGIVTVKIPIQDKSGNNIFEEFNRDHYISALEVMLTVAGENGQQYTETFTASDVNQKAEFSFDPADSMVTVEISLDSLDSMKTGFTENAANQKTDAASGAADGNWVVAGENVTVTADVTFYPTAYSDEEKEQDPTKKDDPIIIIDSATLAGINPMFHSLTANPRAGIGGAKPFVLAVANGRHLQNLAYLDMDFAEENIETIVFTAADAEEDSETVAPAAEGGLVINWKETAEASGNENMAFLPIDFSELTDMPDIEGNGVEIQNLNITAAVDDNAGLFATLKNNSVRDITLKDPNVVVIAPGYVGALAGTTEKTTITNCDVTNGDAVAVAQRAVSNPKVAGGLVGYAKTGTKLTSCTSGANVNGAGGTQSAVGGLVGLAEDAEFTECHAASANIQSGSTADINEDNKNALGGLVGKATDTSEFHLCISHATTQVTSSVGACSNLGGFVGYAEDSEFFGCDSYAVAKGADSDTILNNNLGGFVGYSVDSDYTTTLVQLNYLPQNAKDAGGFSAYVSGGEITNLAVIFTKGATGDETVTNFGGAVSYCKPGTSMDNVMVQADDVIFTNAKNVAGFVYWNSGSISRSFANVRMDNGHAFVGSNVNNGAGMIDNCYGWVQGTGNSLNVTGGTCSHSYFVDGSDANGTTVLYLGNGTKSDVITNTDALRDSWVLDILNEGSDTPNWKAGNSDYPYPTLVVRNHEGFFSDPVTISYPYALRYVETYKDGTASELVMKYGDSMTITGTLSDKDVDTVAYYLCRRTISGTLEQGVEVYRDQNSEDFDNVLKEFNLNGASKLYTIYELTEGKSYGSLGVQTWYPMNADGSYRIRTANQFGYISANAGSTFVVERNITVSDSLETFRGSLSGKSAGVTISTTVPLVGELQSGGTISSLTVNASISGAEDNVGAVAGRMTGGTISGVTVNGSVSGGSNVGAVVGYVSNGTVGSNTAAVTSNASVSGTGTNVGMFLGYAEAGTFTNCKSTVEATLPFGRFAMTKFVTEATHSYILPVNNESKIYLNQYFNKPDFVEVQTQPDTVKANVDNNSCKIIVDGSEHEALVNDGKYYFDVDTSRLLAENSTYSYAARLNTASVTYKTLLEIIGDAENPVMTSYYAANTEKNSYDRLQVTYSTKEVTDDTGTWTEYTFTFTAVADTGFSAGIQVASTGLEESISSEELQLYTFSDTISGDIIDGYYQISLGGQYLAYNNGNLELLSAAPDSMESILWSREADKTWVSYSTEDATKMTINIDSDDSIANLAVIDTLKADRVHAQNVSPYYNYTNLGQAWTPYIPTT